MAKKILAIDDEEEALEILRATLKTKGYEVFVSRSGEEGLEKIKQYTPDLLILDLLMPGVSGLEVLKILKRNPETKDLPVIVISAIGKESGKGEEFWKSGLKVDDYIQKPFDPLDLLGRVEYLFRRQDYVSQRSNIGFAPEAAALKKQKSIENAEPDKVVETFIEAWNSQDFAAEYECLASEMLGSIVKKDYIVRRKQCYLDTQGENVTQKCDRIVNVQKQRNKATVRCIREDVVKGVPRKREEEYILRKIGKFWKIITVRRR